MPIIRFDVLIPDSYPTAPREVAERFERALRILVDKERLSTATVTHSPSTGIPADVVEELREVYARDRGEDAGEATMHRYDVAAAAEGMSYNDLAMSLSRIFTPKAQLPGDRVAEERHVDFEQASVYPWLVEILR